MDFMQHVLRIELAASTCALAASFKPNLNLIPYKVDRCPKETNIMSESEIQWLITSILCRFNIMQLLLARFQR